MPAPLKGRLSQDMPRSSNKTTAWAGQHMSRGPVRAWTSVTPVRWRAMMGCMRCTQCTTGSSPIYSVYYILAGLGCRGRARLGVIAHPVCPPSLGVPAPSPRAPPNVRFLCNASAPHARLLGVALRAFALPLSAQAVPRFKCVVLVSGSRSRDGRHAALYAAAGPLRPTTVPSCHIVGDADFLRARSEELAGCFEAPLVLRHPQGLRRVWASDAWLGRWVREWVHAGGGGVNKGGQCVCMQDKRQLVPTCSCSCSSLPGVRPGLCLCLFPAPCSPPLPIHTHAHTAHSTTPTPHPTPRSSRRRGGPRACGTAAGRGGALIARSLSAAHARGGSELLIARTTTLRWGVGGGGRRCCPCGVHSCVRVMGLTGPGACVRRRRAPPVSRPSCCCRGWSEGGGCARAGAVDGASARRRRAAACRCMEAQRSRPCWRCGRHSARGCFT